MRRAAVLSLRWRDVDFDTGLIRVRQQVQRIQDELHISPVKTRAGNRDLPRIGLAQNALAARREAPATDRASPGRCWTYTGLVSPPGPAGRSSLRCDPRAARSPAALVTWVVTPLRTWAHALPRDSPQKTL